MPQSRHRHKRSHHHHPTPPHHEKPKQRRSAVRIMIIFTAIIGVFAAFLAVGSDPLWLVSGAFFGGIVGYFIGHGMDKAAARNR